MRTYGRFAAAGALLGALAWFGPRCAPVLRDAVAGAEAGVRRAIAATPPPANTPLGAASLRVDRWKWSDLVVLASDPRARVVAVADLDGAVAWRGQEVAVSALGREQFTMARCDAGWCVDGPRLPGLEAVLRGLVRRADAFADANVDGYGPLVSEGYRGAEGDKGALLRRLAADLRGAPRARFRPIAWQIRLERETAEVGEDYEIAVGDRAPRRLRARLTLREEGGAWRFTGGL